MTHVPSTAAHSMPAGLLAKIAVLVHSAVDAPVVLWPQVLEDGRTAEDPSDQILPMPTIEAQSLLLSALVQGSAFPPEDTVVWRTHKVRRRPAFNSYDGEARQPRTGCLSPAIPGQHHMHARSAC